MEKVFDTVTIYWRLGFWGGRGDSECTFHNITRSEALRRAEAFGYRKPVWYRPGTWSGVIITV